MNAFLVSTFLFYCVFVSFIITVASSISERQSIRFGRGRRDECSSFLFTHLKAHFIPTENMNKCEMCSSLSLLSRLTTLLAKCTFVASFYYFISVSLPLLLSISLVPYRIQAKVLLTHYLG